jgi:hypothetical protein
MKQHLQKYFTRATEHHLRKAKHHQAMSTHFGKLATMHKGKSDMEGAAAHYQSISDAHSEMSDEHAGMGEHCAACAKAFASDSRKAMMGDDDPDALVPLEGFSVVTRDAPKSKVFGVPRFGQREIPAPTDADLGKIIGLAPDE